MPALSDFKYLNMSMATKVIIHNAVLPLAGGQGPSQPGTIHFPISLLYFYIIFFLSLTFPIWLLHFYLINSSMVKSNYEIGKVNDKKNHI